MVEKTVDLSCWDNCYALCVQYETYLVDKFSNDASLCDAILKFLKEKGENYVVPEKLKDMFNKLSSYQNNNLKLTSDESSFVQMSSGMYVNAQDDKLRTINNNDQHTVQEASTGLLTVNFVETVKHSLTSELRKVKLKLARPVKVLGPTNLMNNKSETISQCSISTDEDGISVDSVDTSPLGTNVADGTHQLDDNVSLSSESIGTDEVSIKDVNSIFPSEVTTVIKSDRSVISTLEPTHIDNNFEGDNQLINLFIVMFYLCLKRF